MPTDNTELTVESCLAELRELVGPYPQIVVDIRDCGNETRSQHGRVECCAQIGANGEQFTAKTFKKVLAQARKWKAQQQ